MAYKWRISWVVLLCLLANLLLPRLSMAQEEMLSVKLRNNNLREAFNKIEKQTSFRFFYNEGDIDRSVKVNASYNQEPLSSILDYLGDLAKLEFRVIDNNIYVKKRTLQPQITDSGTPPPANFDVIGRILDAENQESLIGVTIVVKGTSIGTVTDFEGNYTIKIPNENSILVFSYLGYETKEILVGTDREINVQMSLAATQLEEVLVVGYGSTQRQDFAGSVAKLSSEDIEALPVTSVDYALQGLASGVQVSANSGTPGGGIRVLVRGIRSINSSNEPLYVVDGVPVLSGSLEQENLGGEVQNLLAGLNPNDIESISVLKDASSTAIYGARGANGVVLITTKKGTTDGKTQIGLNFFTGYGEPVAKWDMLNAAQYREIINESRVNSGLSPFSDFGGNSDVDWQDVVNQTGVVSEYQANVRGGNTKTQYYISASYRDEKGAIIENQFRRGTFRANLNHAVNDKFSIGTSIALSRDLNQRQVSNNFLGPFGDAIVMNPNIAPFDELGNYVFSNIEGFPPGGNPVADARETRYDNQTTKMISNLNLNYTFSPELKFKVDLSYDYNQLIEDHFQPSITSAARSLAGPNFGNRGVFATAEVSTYVIEPVLNFEKLFGTDHKVSGLAGTTFQGRTGLASRIRGLGFGSSDQLTYINAAAETFATSSKVDYTFFSIFSRLGYTYKNKYVLNGTIRRDGSSRFGPNRKFGNFWAASLAWNFIEEPWMEKFKFLSFGKLRIGYGITGNDQIGDFRFLPGWSSGVYLGQSTLAPSQIANPDLTWEETATFDAGLEFGLFNDRITVSAGYFNSLTDGLLFDLPITGRTGFTEVLSNVGQIRNQGWEFDFSSFILNKQSLKWNVGFNISFVKNKIEELAIERPIAFAFAPTVVEVGQPIGTFRTFVFKGVNAVNGDAIFQDVNGDGDITTDDRAIVGGALPEFFGGLTNNITYKNFSLDVLVSFVQGVDLFNFQRWGVENFIPTGNKPAYFLDRWQNEGDITDVPRLYFNSTNNTRMSSRYVEDASYIRLKNVTLGYNFPAATMERLPFQSARLYVTGTNLLTFTNYSGLDPEVNSFNVNGPDINTNLHFGLDLFTPPQLRQIIFGLNLGF